MVLSQNILLSLYLSNFLLFAISPKISNLSFSINHENLLTSVCLGTRTTCYEFALDFTSTFTWLSADSCKQESLDKDNLRDFGYEDTSFISGDYFHTTLYLGDNEDTPEFKYIISTAPNNEFDGKLGLGLSPTSNSRSGLIYQWYSKFYISHRAWAIEFSNTHQGNLYIGEIPHVIIRDYEHYGTCRWEILSKDNQNDIGAPWECSVQGVKIGSNDNAEEVKLSTTRLQFDLGTRRNLLPITDWLKWEHLYFSSQIETGDCNFGVKNNYYTFTCVSEDFNNFHDLIIWFEDWGLRVSKSKLFVYDDVDQEYEFIFYAQEGYEKVLLSRSVMDKFITVFDEENHQIGFYSGGGDAWHWSNSKVEPPKTYENDEGDHHNTPIQPGTQEVPIGPITDPNSENPFRPPFLPGNPDDNGQKVIPTEPSGGFWSKLFKVILVLSLIIGLAFVSLLGFRYFRRKKFSKPAFYYKAADELFNEGTQLE